MHLQAALITLLTVVIIAVAMMLVGRARGQFQVHAPATTGHPDFERAFRAHQNTLEQTVMFLPLLWLATVYSNEQWAAWSGYAWLVGRACTCSATYTPSMVAAAAAVSWYQRSPWWRCW